MDSLGSNNTVHLPLLPFLQQSTNLDVCYLHNWRTFRNLSKLFICIGPVSLANVSEVGQITQSCCDNVYTDTSSTKPHLLRKPVFIKKKITLSPNTANIICVLPRSALESQDWTLESCLAFKQTASYMRSSYQRHRSYCKGSSVQLWHRKYKNTMLTKRVPTGNTPGSKCRGIDLCVFI